MHPKSRAGLTLIEVVVAMVIIAIVVAAIAPSILGSLDRERVGSAVELLAQIRDAMSEMRADNQDWPGRVSHVATPITTSDRNVCGNTYANGKVNQWAGPYLDRIVPTTGLNIGIGVLQDSTYRSFLSGNDGLLTMQVDDVSVEDVYAVNRAVDGDGDVAGQNTGTVRWDAADSEGRVTMYYYRPIRGC